MRQKVGKEIKLLEITVPSTDFLPIGTNMNRHVRTDCKRKIKSIKNRFLSSLEWILAWFHPLLERQRNKPLRGRKERF